MIKRKNIGTSTLDIEKRITASKTLKNVIKELKMTETLSGADRIHLAKLMYMLGIGKKEINRMLGYMPKDVSRIGNMLRENPIKIREDLRVGVRESVKMSVLAKFGELVRDGGTKADIMAKLRLSEQRYVIYRNKYKEVRELLLGS